MNYTFKACCSSQTCKMSACAAHGAPTICYVAVSTRINEAMGRCKRGFKCFCIQSSKHFELVCIYKRYRQTEEERLRISLCHPACGMRCRPSASRNNHENIGQKAGLSNQTRTSHMDPLEAMALAGDDRHQHHAAEGIARTSGRLNATKQLRDENSGCRHTHTKS